MLPFLCVLDMLVWDLGQFSCLAGVTLIFPMFPCSQKIGFTPELRLMCYLSGAASIGMLSLPCAIKVFASVQAEVNTSLCGAHMASFKKIL